MTAPTTVEKIRGYAIPVVNALKRSFKHPSDVYSQFVDLRFFYGEYEELKNQMD